MFPVVYRSIVWQGTVFRNDAQQGHVIFLKVKALYTWLTLNDNIDDIFNVLARIGDIEALKWLCSTENLRSSINPPLEQICEYASSCGQLDVITWALMEDGYDEDNSEREDGNRRVWALDDSGVDTFRIFSEYSNGDPCATASENGQLDALKLLRLKYGYVWSSSAPRAACASGQLETLTWCIENGAHIDETCVEACAKSGHLDCLEMILEHHPWVISASKYAITNAHLHVLEFCIERGLEIDESACVIACDVRQRDKVVELLEFLVFLTGMEIEEEAIKVMIRNSDLQTLTWVFLNWIFSFSVMSELLRFAPKNVHIEVMEFLLRRDNRLKINSKLLLSAAESGSIEVLEFCLMNVRKDSENDIEMFWGDDLGIFGSVASADIDHNKALGSILWMSQNGFFMDERVLLNAIAQENKDLVSLCLLGDPIPRPDVAQILTYLDGVSPSFESHVLSTCFEYGLMG